MWYHGVNGKALHSVDTSVTHNGPRCHNWFISRQLRMLQFTVTMDISLPPYPSMDVSSLSDVLDATLPPPPPQSVLEDYMVSPFEVDTRAEAKIIEAYNGSERLVIGKPVQKLMVGFEHVYITGMTVQ